MTSNLSYCTTQLSAVAEGKRKTIHNIKSISRIIFYNPNLQKIQITAFQAIERDEHSHKPLERNGKPKLLKYKGPLRTQATLKMRNAVTISTHIKEQECPQSSSPPSKRVRMITFKFSKKGKFSKCSFLIVYFFCVCVCCNVSLFISDPYHLGPIFLGDLGQVSLNLVYLLNESSVNWMII